MLTKLANNLNAPTPRWAGIIRNIAIACTSIAGAIVAAPVGLPALVISAAGYMALGGSILTVIAQSFTVSE